MELVCTMHLFSGFKDCWQELQFHRLELLPWRKQVAGGSMPASMAPGWRRVDGEPLSGLVFQDLLLTLQVEKY